MQRKIINNNIDFFLITIASVSSIIIYLSRLGFDNDGMIILKSLSLSYLIILFPKFVFKFFFKNDSIYFLTQPILSLLIILLIIISGILKYFTGFDLLYVYFIFGFLLFFFYTLSKLLNLKINKQSIFILLFSIIFSVFITSAYYGNHYIHPLMIEKIINGAWPHRDVFYHSAISGIFKTYFFNGTGLDGLVPHYYHSLSHSIFALFSLVIDINTLDFYSIVFPILIIPIFFMFFLFSIFELSYFFSKLNNFKIIDQRNYFLWILMYIFFTLSIYFNFAREKYTYIQSQSYAVALIILFIITYLFFVNANYQLLTENLKLKKISSYLFSIFIFLLSICASYSKVSFLYLLTIIGLFIFLRLKLYKQFYYFLLLIFWIVFIFYIYFDLLSLFDGRDIYIENTYTIDEVYHDYNSLRDEFFYSFTSISFIILKLISLKIFSLKSFFYNLKNKKILDIELVFLIIISLYIIPFQYFKGLQLYISYILIIAHFNLFHRFFFKNEIIK